MAEEKEQADATFKNQLTVQKELKEFGDFNDSQFTVRDLYPRRDFSTETFSAGSQSVASIRSESPTEIMKKLAITAGEFFNSKIHYFPQPLLVSTIRTCCHSWNSVSLKNHVLQSV